MKAKTKADPVKAARIKYFSPLIKRARASEDLSQAALGICLGYTSGQFISAWECGTQEPPLWAWRKLIADRAVNFSEVMAAIKKVRESQNALEVKAIAEELRA